MSTEAQDPKPPFKPSIQEIFLMAGAFAGLVYAVGWISRFFALSNLGLGQFTSTKEKALAAGILAVLLIIPACAWVALRKRGIPLLPTMGATAFLIATVSSLIAGFRAPYLLDVPSSWLTSFAVATVLQLIVCLGALLIYAGGIQAVSWGALIPGIVPLLFLSAIAMSFFLDRVEEALGGIRCVAGEVELKDKEEVLKGFLMETDGDFISLVVPKPGAPNPAPEGQLLIVPKGEIQQIRIARPFSYAEKLGLPPQPH